MCSLADGSKPPGVIGGRFASWGCLLSNLGGIHRLVKALFIVEGNRRLALPEDAIGRSLALVQQGHCAIEGLTDGDPCTAQAVSMALPGELVFPVLELEAQVLGQGTGMVQAEDEVEFLLAVQHRAMGVGRVLGWDGEVGVVVGDEARQEGIGRLDVGDAGQAQLLNQAVLEGLIGPFDPPLGLGRVGVDGLDVEGLEGAGELRQLALALGMVDAEDAVLVGI